MSHPRIHKALTPLILLLALCFGLINSASAHPANVAGGRARIKTDGTFTMEARFDLLAYMVGETPIKVADAPMNALLDGPPENLQKALKAAEAKFVRETALKADNGAGVIDSIQFPTLAQVQDWRDNGLPPRLPVMLVARIKGHFPDGAHTISFGVPPLLGTFVFTEEVENQEPFTQALENGALSTPLPLLTGLPQPTPQAPGESPAALFVPKKQAAPKAATPKQKAVAKPTVKAAKSQAKPRPRATKRPRPAAVAAIAAPKPPKPGTRSQSRDSMNSAPVKPTIGDTKVSTLAPKAGAPKLAQLAKPTGPVAATNSGSEGAASDKIEESPFSSNSANSAGQAPIERAQNARPSWFSTFAGFVQMGFVHILPRGVDHILFVLGLFLLGSQLPALIKQITAFTIAHSLTLALAAAGLVRLPANIVEPLIALSIVFVAIENLTTKEVRPWRILVVFAFGLVHGLGFAEVFQDLGLAGAGFLSALAGFNIGVELGQLSVVALALLAVGWFRQREGYRKFVVVPASLAIAAVAAFWTLQRVFFSV